MKSIRSELRRPETPGPACHAINVSRMRRAGVWVALVVLVCVAKPSAGADLTATQELIKNEILRLGGDWEPHLIGFIGPKFTERHYEMLKHMTDITTVALMNVDVPTSAYSSIARMRTVKFIEIQGSSCSGEGMESLRRLPNLRRLYIDDAKLTKRGMESLSQLEQLETLELDDVELPVDSLGLLGKMRGLKSLSVDVKRIDQEKPMLTKKEIESLSRLETLETLTLDDVELAADSLGLLGKMRGLKSLFVYSKNAKRVEIEKLKASLPNCEVSIPSEY